MSEIEFPSGRLSMYGRNAINQDATLEKAAEIAQRINVPSTLQSIIEGKDGFSELITSQKFDDGTLISLVHPTGPYTDRALMLGIYNKDMKENGDTHWIYDYPKDKQERFWGMVLAGLHAGREILDKEGRTEVINLWAESDVHVSDVDERTSRTIRFPHGHFIEIDINRIHPSTLVLHHMEEEQDVLERGYLVERFGSRVLQRMPEYQDVLLAGFKVRKSAPFGYEFELPDELNEANIDLIVQVMDAHHKAIKETSVHYINKTRIVDRKIISNPDFSKKLDRVIKPPSYRLYMFLDGGHLSVIISPEFWSHGGVLEAMKITLDRDPKHPLMITEEEKRDYGRRFAEIVSHELEGPG